MSYNFKWLHKNKSISAVGISLADLIIRAKNKEEGIMTRLIQYFKNRQVRKHMKERIKVWLLSENVEGGLPIAPFPAKQ